MNRNPIPAIRSGLLEGVGVESPPIPSNRTYFAFDFSYFAVQHPRALKLDLACEISWNQAKREVHLVVHQATRPFSGWGEQGMDFLFAELTNVFHEDVSKHVPEWGNFMAGVMPYRIDKNTNDYFFAYISCIECREYELDEVVDLSFASFDAGKDVLMYSQSIIEALVCGERSLNIGEHVERMKRMIAEQERTLVPRDPKTRQ